MAATEQDAGLDKSDSSPIEEPMASTQDIETLMKELSCTKEPRDLPYSYRKQYRRIIEKEVCYPMTHSQRGWGVVITMTAGRPGWKSDIIALYPVFLHLNIGADYLFDLTREELLNRLNKLAESKETENVDCLFVVLMGHGGKEEEIGKDKNKEYLKTADGSRFFVREELASIFDNTKHRHLINKPKVFIVQMCRGLLGKTTKTETPGKVTKTEGDVVVIPPNRQTPPLVSIPVQESTKSRTKGIPVIQPSEAPFSDYIFGFATQPGSRSYRETYSGSWYIQELSHVFLANAAEKDVTNMLVEVNRRLKNMSFPRLEKQTGEFHSGLNFPLYLFPGLDKDTSNKPLKRLDSPERVLEISAAANPDIQGVFRVVGLRDQGALLSFGFNNFSVMRVSDDGKRKTPDLRATDSDINALVLPGEELLVLESKGRISRVHLDDLGKPPVQTWQVKVKNLWDAAAVNEHQVVIVDNVDNKAGQIILFDLQTSRADTKVKELDSPSSVAYIETDGNKLFAVAEQGKHRVLVYDANWAQISEVGTMADEERKLKVPTCCRFLPPWEKGKSANLLIADRDNHRISEFELTGEFVRHWLIEREGLKHPSAISFVFPCLWVVHSPGQRCVSKYQIYYE